MNIIAITTADINITGLSELNMVRFKYKYQKTPHN